LLIRILITLKLNQNLITLSAMLLEGGRLAMDDGLDLEPEHGASL